MFFQSSVHIEINDMQCWLKLQGFSVSFFLQDQNCFSIRFPGQYWSEKNTGKENYQTSRLAGKQIEGFPGKQTQDSSKIAIGFYRMYVGSLAIGTSKITQTDEICFQKLPEAPRARHAGLRGAALRAPKVLLLLSWDFNTFEISREISRIFRKHKDFGKPLMYSESFLTPRLLFFATVFSTSLPWL